MLITIWAFGISQLVIKNTASAFRREYLFNETSGQNGSLHYRRDIQRQKYYLIGVFVAYNFLPFVAVFYWYSRIVMKLRRRGEEVRLSHATRSQHSNFKISNQRKTMVMLISVLVVLLICGWPYTILHIIIAFNEVQTMSTTLELLKSMLRLLAFLPAIINPIIYNFFSDKFRAGFCQVLFSVGTCNNKWWLHWIPATTPDSFIDQ